MIKNLMKSIREYKTASLMAPFLVLFEAVMDVLIPYIMAYLIDDGIYKNDMNYIAKSGGLLLLCCVISLVFGTLSGKFAAKASAGFAKNLRHDVFYKIQDFSFANIDKFQSSGLITRLTTDITNIQNAYMMIIRVAVRAPAMLIFALAMTININSKLTLIYLCVLPVLIIVLTVLVKFAMPTIKKVFSEYDVLNNVVGENLHGMRVVKSFNRENYENEKFDSVSGRIYKLFVRAENYMACNMPVMQLCIYGSMLLIAWIGAKMIIVGQGAPGAFTTGELTSFISYTMQILMSLIMVSMVFVMIVMSRASAERVTEVLEEKPDIKNPDNPLTKVEDGSLKFDNVSFSYAKDKDKLCLMNINLDIKSGETIGILGATGSSKSSLVQLISRLYDVTKGTLYVGGNDVRNYDIQTLRDSVSIVLQKNVLFSGTIKDNIRWGKKDATDEEIVNACRLACADDFIEQMPDKYDTYIEQDGGNVSGGQKQRLCIARAVIKNPQILILDDSTSAVDTKTDSRIRSSMKDYLPDCTKLIIAQRISSIQSADRIIVMNNGSVQDVGTHEELINSNEMYREIYKSQNKEVN